MSEGTRSKIFLQQEIVLRAVQQDSFSGEISALEDKIPVSKRSPLRKLDPFLDKKGLLHVGDR